MFVLLDIHTAMHNKHSMMYNFGRKTNKASVFVLVGACIRHQNHSFFVKLSFNFYFSYLLKIFKIQIEKNSTAREFGIQLFCYKKKVHQII